MIKYSLRCGESHEFEAWFASSSAFDKQSAAHQILCPECGTNKVIKALMAPNIVSSQARNAGALENQREFLDAMRELRRHVAANSEFVGTRFAEEALKIHHDEAEARSIHGAASEPEVEHLREEGVEFYPLPVLPEDQN